MTERDISHPTIQEKCDHISHPTIQEKCECDRISHPTIQEKYDQLNEAKTRLEETQHRKKETHQSPPPPPKIQRVAHHLRAREHFAKHYSPKLVSIGPMHHGAKGLKLGEQYKRMWTVMYIESTKQTAQTLLQIIVDNINDLKELFTEDALGGFDDDEELSWMLFVDGCSLLQILNKANLDLPEELNVKLDQLILVVQDVLLLENQLPFRVLKLLSSCDDDNEAKLIETMGEFIRRCHHLSPDGPDTTYKCGQRQDVSVVVQVVSPAPTDAARATATATARATAKATAAATAAATARASVTATVTATTPAHLLDRLHGIIVADRNRKEDDKAKPSQERGKGTKMITYRNIQELKAAGIKVKKSTSRYLTDISFTPSGFFGAHLRLPEIIVDDTTAPTFLNLIAYEMCPDFDNNYEICSLVVLLDSLIDHPDDVKQLRSAGILYNALGSDEEVATLFNSISADLVADLTRYGEIRSKIEEHYTNKWKTWYALGYHTYFSNPWALIGFLAAAIALILTFVQTWYATPLGS